MIPKTKEIQDAIKLLSEQFIDLDIASGKAIEAGTNVCVIGGKKLSSGVLSLTRSNLKGKELEQLLQNAMDEVKRNNQQSEINKRN